MSFKSKPIKLMKETQQKKIMLVLTQLEEDVLIQKVNKNKKTTLKTMSEEIQENILVGQLANRLELRGWKRMNGTD